MDYREQHQRGKNAVKAIRYIKYILKTCKKHGKDVTRDMKILDFGCGSGDAAYFLVKMGYNAYGYDLYYNLSDCSKKYSERFLFYDNDRNQTDLVNYAVDLGNFCLPYDDCSFDIVITSQVFEHIFNHEKVIREFRRVMRDDGISINTFPPKYVLIDAHIKILWGQIIKFRPYYFLCALLGIRNEFQKGKSIMCVTNSNYHYAQTGLNYISTKEFRRIASQYFSYISIETKQFNDILMKLRKYSFVKFFLENCSRNITAVLKP